MTQPFYLTPSRITEALQCPLRYHRNYVQKLEHAKPSLSMFQGSRQHDALEAWAKREGELVPLYEEAWLREVPELFRKKILAHLLAAWEERKALHAELEEFAAQLVAGSNGKVKQPRATKAYKEQAEKLGSKALEDRIARLEGVERSWFASDESPWKKTSYPPSVVFLEGAAALREFEAWWQVLGDGRPDIVHTEVKATLLIGDGRYKLTGVIDAIYLWPDGTTEVVDYKRARGPDGNLSHFTQSAVYTLTCQQVLGITPDLVTFHHLKDADRVRFEVKDGWTERLLFLCDRVKRMHDSNDFGPTFRTCNWCDYEALCREYFDFVPIVEGAAA